MHNHLQKMNLYRYGVGKKKLLITCCKCGNFAVKSVSKIEVLKLPVQAIISTFAGIFFLIR